MPWKVRDNDYDVTENTSCTIVFCLRWFQEDSARVEYNLGERVRLCSLLADGWVVVNCRDTAALQRLILTPLVFPQEDSARVEYNLGERVMLTLS